MVVCANSPISCPIELVADVALLRATVATTDNQVGRAACVASRHPKATYVLLLKRHIYTCRVVKAGKFPQDSDLPAPTTPSRIRCTSRPWPREGPLHDPEELRSVATLDLLSMLIQRCLQTARERSLEGGGVSRAWGGRLYHETKEVRDAQRACRGRRNSVRVQGD